MMARTCGRMPGEVISTGSSPSCAAFSKPCWMAPMNCCSREGAIARCRSLPSRAERQQRQIAVRTQIGGADLAGEAGAHVLGNHLGAAAGARHLGNALEDRRQVADGDALGEQGLQDPLDARYRDL